MSTAPDHPKLQVSRRPAGTKRYKTKLVYYYPHLGRAQDHNVFNSDINAMERAAKERLFYVKGKDGGFVEPPNPDPEAFLSWMEVIEKKLKENSRIVSPLTKDQFLGAYVGRKRTIYENAFNSLLVKPLNREDSTVKFFVKQEKTNFTRKPNSVPRGISPRDPRYHVSLGPYIKRIEKLVYKSIDQLWGHPTIMKGKNAEKRGKAVLHHWKQYKKPVAVGIDASRFDQHVHQEALMFEHRVYLEYYTGSHKKKLAKLLEKQLVNKGRGYAQDGKVKFKLDGKRMSGDMNTALGNCLLMSTMVYYVLNKHNINASFINDGDDGVIFLESEDLRRLQDVIAKECLDFGHEVVLEEAVDRIEDIEFCQCKFVFRNNLDLIAVRDIKNSFDKDSMCLDPLPQPKTSRKWMRAVGDGGAALTSGLPVLQEYYEHYRRQSSVALKVIHREGFHMLSEGMGSPRWREPSDISRLSFWKAFGMAPDYQRMLEKLFQTMETEHSVAEPTKPYLPYTLQLML